MNKKFNLVRVTTYNNIEIDSVIMENQDLTIVMSKMDDMLKSDNLEIVEHSYDFCGTEIIYHTTDDNIIYCVVEVKNG